jgi:hypothetical protein
LDLSVALSLDADEGPKGELEDEENFENDMIMPKVDNQKHIGQVCAMDLQVIGEWKQIHFSYEKEDAKLKGCYVLTSKSKR